jgi:purine nucleoside phosphorylase
VALAAAAARRRRHGPDTGCYVAIEGPQFHPR